LAVGIVKTLAEAGSESNEKFDMTKKTVDVQKVT
jgi:hypothetical protein